MTTDDILLITTKREPSKGVERMDARAMGRKLRALRADKTPDEVAAGVGISVYALTMYEMGERIPRDEVKLRLSVYYGTSLEELFFEPEEHVS